MKRVLAIILSMAMVLGLLAGCGAKPAEPTSTPAATENPQTQAPAEPAQVQGENQQDVVAAEDGTEEDAKYGGVFKMNFQSPTNSLDPAMFSTNQNTTPGYHIYEGPVVLDEGGKVFPMVCEYDVSDDGLTMAFKVREGVKFHNGDTVDAYDVLTSINRSCLWSSKMQSYFGDYVDSYETPDDMTVVYHLKQMAPLALVMMGDITSVCKIMPKEIIDKLGDDGTITDDADIIGTGPYKLGEWKKDVSVSLVRFDDYVPYENGGTGPAAPKMAYYDEILCSVATDSLARTTGMIAGEYSYTTSTVADMTPQLEEAGCWVSTNWNGWSPTIKFNLSEKNSDSIVQDVNFRRAVLAAMDFYAYRATCSRAPEYYKVDGCLVPDTSAYYNDVLHKDNSNFDLDKAKEYLAASGYNGETIVWICAECDSYYSMSLPCSQMLQAIGVNVDLQIRDAGTYDTEITIEAGDWDICALEKQKGAINPMLTHYCNGLAECWWESEAKDAALEKMATTVAGSPESIEAFREYCEAVRDEVPFIICIEFGTPCWYAEGVVPVKAGINVYWWNSYNSVE